MSKSTESSASHRNATTTSGTRTARWQPSTRDISSPTYDGSGGYRSLGSPARSRPRLGWAAVGLVTVIGLVALLQHFSVGEERPSSGPLGSVAVLEIAQGAVGLLVGPEPVSGAADSASATYASLGAGAPIQLGAVLDSSYRTDMPGRAALRLASGPSVRIDHGTRIRMASATAMVLDRGAVYVDSAAGSEVEVRTVFGVVRDIGTQFEVRLLESEDPAEKGPVLRVRVREGEIELEPERGAQHTGTVGEEVILYGDGKVERRDVAIHGADWDWALQLAPSVELEGWSLQRFVTWLGREGGWEIRYETPEIEEQARAITLHGSSRELSPLEAAAMVFEGTGLRFRVEGAELRIGLPEVAPE